LNLERLNPVLEGGIYCIAWSGEGVLGPIFAGYVPLASQNPIIK